jgi:hypothetical protein
MVIGRGGESPGSGRIRKADGETNNAPDPLMPGLILILSGK